jgi:hypothetical protein
VQQELDEIGHQQAIQRDRVEISQRQLSGAVELAAKGYLSQVELRRRQNDYLGEQQSESALTKERLAKAADLSELRDRLQQLPARPPRASLGPRLRLPKSRPD